MARPSILVLGIIRSTPQANAYGPPPAWAIGTALRRPSIFGRKIHALGVR
jgi:hypothetical protein